MTKPLSDDPSPPPPERKLLPPAPDGIEPPDDEPSGIPPDLLRRFFMSEEDFPVQAAHLRSVDMLVATAWQTSSPQWERPEAEPPTDDAELWEWLWDGVLMDLDRIAANSGLPAYIAVATLRRLASQKLVYPNGMISPWFVKVSAMALQHRYRQ